MTSTPAALGFSVDTCTIGRAMGVLGEKWTMVVLREIFNGIRRFDDMRIRTGIPRQVLANRLASLVEHGLLRREPDPCNGRYTVAILTDEGWDLVVKAAPGHVDAVRHYVIDGLTDEQIKAVREVACHVTARVQSGMPECTE